MTNEYREMLSSRDLNEYMVLIVWEDGFWREEEFVFKT